MAARVRFEWEHGVAFGTAQFAFADRRRVIAEDLSHSSSERRFLCLGLVDGGVLTVRFTMRGRVVIRIIGAGYWRKGKRLYEQNQLHRRAPRKPAGHS